MPPPSRGKLNGGALAPSVRGCAFSTDELLLREVGEAAEEGDFNLFDAALCDVSADPFLVDLLAVGRVLVVVLALILVTEALEAFEDFAFCGRREDVLGDFLRDFLDIRLPFVAFGGSIITVLRTRIGVPDSSRRLGKSDGLGIWLQGFRRTACPLVE